jgi:hypothetical protein
MSNKRAYLISLILILLIVSVYAVWGTSENFGLKYKGSLKPVDISPTTIPEFLAHSDNKRKYTLDKGFTVDFFPEMNKTCVGKQLGTFSSTAQDAPLTVPDKTKYLRITKTK